MDLDRKIFFSNIVETNLRPDVVFQQSKTLVAVKVTVPWEESCKEVHGRKAFHGRLQGQRMMRLAVFC